MKKNWFLLSLASIFALAGLCSGLAHAEEGIEPHTIEGDDSGLVTTNDQPDGSPTDSPETNADQGSGVNEGQVSPENPNCETENCETEDNIDHEGTSGEPLVVCADKNEPGCENYDPSGADPAEQEEEDLDEETPLWPMFVSFGALGGALVLIIIINIAGRNRKK